MSKAGFGFRMEISRWTEILIVTAQNQSIRTNLVKAKQEIKLEISGMNISQKVF